MSSSRMKGTSKAKAKAKVKAKTKIKDIENKVLRYPVPTIVTFRQFDLDIPSAASNELEDENTEMQMRMSPAGKSSSGSGRDHVLRLEKKPRWEWCCCKCQTANKIDYEGARGICRGCKHDNSECRECTDYTVGR